MKMIKKIRFMLRMVRLTIAEWFLGREDYELSFSKESDNRRNGDSIAVLSQIAREHQTGTGYTSTAATMYA